MKNNKTKSHIAYISLGSNMGDKYLNCQSGIDVLTKSSNITLIAQSYFYETEPVDYTDQDWFVNAVVKIETLLDPFQLLKKLKSIEREAGRDDNTIRFGPRILDMDILLYDNAVIDNPPDLHIPHPRMHQRRFVLQPMCDIAPKQIHPVFNRDMEYLLNNLNDKEQRVRRCI